MEYNYRRRCCTLSAVRKYFFLVAQLLLYLYRFSFLPTHNNDLPVTVCAAYAAWVGFEFFIANPVNHHSFFPPIYKSNLRTTVHNYIVYVVTVVITFIINCVDPQKKKKKKQIKL